MPRKKSVKRSAQQFIAQIAQIRNFIADADVHCNSSRHVSWAYEYAIIRLSREFEALVLDALVGAINNNTNTISQSTGVKFPKHLTDEVCRYLIVRTGYFDFRGRDGLIKILKQYVPGNHYLVQIVSRTKYKKALEELPALRNLAAHNSLVAKRSAKKVTGQSRMPEAGVWLRIRIGNSQGKKSRFETIADALEDLATEISQQAPY